MGSCFGLVELPIYNRKTHRFVSPTGHLFGFDPPACRNEKGPNGAIQGSLPFTQSPLEKPRHVKLFFWGHLRSLMKVVFWLLGPFANFGCLSEGPPREFIAKRLLPQDGSLCAGRPQPPAACAAMRRGRAVRRGIFTLWPWGFRTTSGCSRGTFPILSGILLFMNSFFLLSHSFRGTASSFPSELA